MTDTNCSLPAHPDHDARGRFAKGNKGGPGNHTARRMAEVRELLFACVGPERFQALVERLYSWAMAGNLKAVKLLLEYTIGKPVPAADPDDFDLPRRAPAPSVETAPSAETSPAATPAPAAEAAPTLSPLARSVLRRAARRAAKKAAKAAAAHR